MSLRVVLVNQFYPPSPAPTGVLLRDLARALRARGHAVAVLASAGLYGSAAAAGEAADDAGIAVRRLGRARAHGDGFARKAADYLFFHLRAAWALRRISPRPDAIVAMTTPPFIGARAARYARRRGIPVILWCMDLYPEALAANGRPKSGGRLYGRLERWARIERESAAAAVVIGPDMRARVAASAPAARIVEIPVWSRRAATEPDRRAALNLRRERGWAEDDVVLMYSGHMGRAHRVEEFVALAAALREAPARFRLVFCGAGAAQMSWFRAGAGLFEWLDPVPESRLTAHLLSADVHLVSQQPEWTGIVVPSKYQAAGALGRPVFFAGPADSAVARWIVEGETGWVAAPEDGDAVARAALELRDPEARRVRGNNAARRHRELFDPEKRLRQWALLVEATVRDESVRRKGADAAPRRRGSANE